MREKHPIDERFGPLHDAEISPPAAVRDALAQRFGWDAGKSGGAWWRNGLLLVSGIVLVASSASYLSSNRRMNASEEVLTGVPPLTYENTRLVTPEGDSQEQGVDLPVSLTPAETSEVPDGPTGGASRMARATKSTTPVAEALSPTRKTEQMSGPDDPGSSPLKRARLDRPTSDTHPQRNQAEMNRRGAGANIRSGREQGTTGEPMPGALSHTMEGDAAWLSILPPAGRIIANGSPIPNTRPAPYVIPNPQWWVGAYVGLGAVNGSWRGVDAEALDQAERWRNTTQWGLLVGRCWKSGWSVSGGAGLALTRSTFIFEEQKEESFLEVDTVWSSISYPASTELIYTYDIDSARTIRPVDTRTVQARNLYGNLHVPISIAWHGDLQRWHYGGFGGVTAWIPTQREGTTLQRKSLDGGLTAVSLDDPAMDDRYPFQLHGHLGLSLGYALSESLGIFAEPTVSTPLISSSAATTAWMTRSFIQIRIQYELGTLLR